MNPSHAGDGRLGGSPSQCLNNTLASRAAQAKESLQIPFLGGDDPPLEMKQGWKSERDGIVKCEVVGLYFLGVACWPLHPSRHANVVTPVCLPLVWALKN